FIGSITVLPASSATGSRSWALSGKDARTRSAARAVSAGVAARARGPSSATRAASVSGPREVLRMTSTPASAARRATPAPIVPAPMTPRVDVLTAVLRSGGDLDPSQPEWYARTMISDDRQRSHDVIDQEAWN